MSASRASSIIYISIRHSTKGRKRAFIPAGRKFRRPIMSLSIALAPDELFGETLIGLWYAGKAFDTCGIHVHLAHLEEEEEDVEFPQRRLASHA